MLAAVIVTYNRKEMLGENIKMLLKQIIAFDKIFIVDNCSTDGTYQYLEEHGWIKEPFVYIKTETNIGGAGGFYTGTKAAFDQGADWIILMDDDGKAADINTFAILKEVAEKLYKQESKVFVNTLVQQGELLSFKMGNAYTVEEEIEKAIDGIIKDEANPFNGTMVSRELVAEIGYPNREFFIKGDEVNYKQRAVKAGAIIATAVNARYIHPRPETHEKLVLGIKVPFFVEAPWKEYYAARNFTYMYKEAHQYKAIIFELILVKILAIFSMQCSKRQTLKMLFKGVSDGWRAKLGARVKP